MINRRRTRKNSKYKRGFTLVELLVAMAIMGIVTSTLSIILTSTYALYDRNEMTTTLFNVSQKLHIAINSELSCCQDMYVYKEDKIVKTNYDEHQAMIYLDTTSGYILKDSSDGKNAHLLLSDRSYKGAVVKSISIKVGYVNEANSYDEPDTKSQKRRLLYVTTVLAKGKVEYTHTSAIKLYNMLLWGTEITKANNASYSDEFHCVIFHTSQYYALN